MSVTKDSKNKKKKVSSSGYIAKAIPHGMIQVGTADDGTKIYSASTQIVKQYFPELYKLKPGQTNYIFTGKNGKYTPVRQSDNSYDKFINKDLLRTSNQNIQKEQKEQEVTTYSNNTPAANPYNVDDVTLKEQQKKLDWFDHGRQQWLDEQDAKVRRTAPSNHPWQLAFGTVLPAAVASSFITAPLATTTGFITFPYASQVFNDIWSNMNRPQPISGMNMAYVDGKYVNLGNFTPHQLLPKEARGKTWDEQVSSGLQKLGMSKENADAIAPFSNLGGIVGAGFASNAARPVDAAITNLARSKGYAFTPTKYTFSKIGETNREGLLGGISSLKPTEAMQFGEDLVFNYLGSNRHINQIMKSGVSRQEATKIANQLYTNATRARGELVDPKALIKPTDMGSYDRNLVYDRHLGLTYDPKYKVANDLYNEDIVTTVSHELGGHGATYSIIGETIPKEELPVVKRYFPAYRQIVEHNIKLKPQRKPEYVNGASDTETEKLIKYLEDPEEYTAVARSYHITDSPATLDDLYEFFTKESVDNLVNNVWSKIGDINKEGVESTLVGGIRKLNKHVQGDEAVKMFKEYGGEPIPEGSINGEQLRKYVPEARERYGIVGDTRITDEEIAQALYKHVKELGGNTAAKNQQGEPQLLFRGDTKPYTELRERISPEKASTMGGTMDNSLGTLFLGEMPNSNARDAGILKYLNYGSYVYDPQGNIINVVWRPSQTGGASIKIGNKVYTDWFDSPNMSKEPSIANIPEGSTLIEERAIPGTEFTEKKYKLPLSTTGTEAQDINAFVVKTPSTYNMSNQMQVLGQSEALDPRYNFQWLTDETPRAYLDKDGFPWISYKGNEYPNLYGNEARPLWADQYRAILNNAQENNAGLLVSEPRSPFRNEHRGYTYAILPNFNIRRAKHILPYDLRIPRNWNDKNIYRVLFPLGISLGTIGVNNSDENKNQ